MNRTSHLSSFLMLLAVLCAASAAGFAQTDQTIDLNGVPCRIRIPGDWNHGLVVYTHGYLPPGGHWKPMPDVYSRIFVDRGFALIESGYSRQGWAVAEALEETEALRAHFAKTYGAPKMTFVTGFSMGGLIALASIESRPEAYDGALPMCGPLAGGLPLFTRAFDMLVTFEAVFGARLATEYLPLVAASSLPEEVASKALETDTAAAERFARRWDVREADLAGILSFYHLMYRECVERAGGNPIDNRNTIYTGFEPEARFNGIVPRYAADPKAVEYLRRNYSPTGAIEGPVLALHTTYDPGVSPELPSSYTLTAALEGNEDRFVQMYVAADGHCNFPPELIGKAFDALLAWAAEGTRPSPGVLR